MADNDRILNEFIDECDRRHRAFVASCAQALQNVADATRFDENVVVKLLDGLFSGSTPEARRVLFALVEQSELKVKRFKLMNCGCVDVFVMLPAIYSESAVCAYFRDHAAMKQLAEAHTQRGILTDLEPLVKAMGLAAITVAPELTPYLTANVPAVGNFSAYRDLNMRLFEVSKRMNAS